MYSGAAGGGRDAGSRAETWLRRPRSAAAGSPRHPAASLNAPGRATLFGRDEARPTPLNRQVTTAFLLRPVRPAHGKQATADGSGGPITCPTSAAGACAARSSAVRFIPRGRARPAARRKGNESRICLPADLRDLRRTYGLRRDTIRPPATRTVRLAGSGTISAVDQLASSRLRSSSSTDGWPPKSPWRQPAGRPQ